MSADKVRKHVPITTIWLEKRAIEYALLKVYGVYVEEDTNASRVRVSHSDREDLEKMFANRVLEEAVALLRERGLDASGIPHQTIVFVDTDEAGA